MPNAITKSAGRLNVPDDPIVPFIEGDGTGPDIWRASVRVLDAAVEKAYGGTRKIAWMEVYAGEKSSRLFNSWLPDNTVDAFREYYVGIKGPLTTPVGGGIRSLNVALRQLLDLYVCLRPVRRHRVRGGPPRSSKAARRLRTRVPQRIQEDPLRHRRGVHRLAEGARGDRRPAPRRRRAGRRRFETDQLPRLRAADSQRDHLRHPEQAEERDVRPQRQHHEIHRRRV